jgi:signal transduction histidine kinase
MNDTGSRILVIDDNPTNLDVLSELLDKQNFVVLFALDGQSSLQRSESGQPDIILLDVLMPGMDGFEVCRRLKTNEKTKAIPVIFMTALSETVDKVKGFQLGAVDYITKPIEPEEVLARITTHLKIRRLQCELHLKNEELYASNQQLQSALERERELSKLKSRFISIASHELRSPLATIQMTVDTLDHYSSSMTEDRKKTFFERIKHSVNDITEILNNVLLLSKVEAENYDFNPESTDVVTLCRYILEDIKVLSEGTHNILFSSPEESLQVIMDPKLMRHVLLNLLSNAIKYSYAGSSIHFDLFQHENNVVFRVRDKGIGIARADQLHLFDAFHRGENVGKITGTGLGLSIVKQFVDLHHGTISVESRMNQGTTFTVMLPIKSELK